MNPNAGLNAAIEHIRRYVERGDSLQSLKEGYMGTYIHGGRSASIGGFLDGISYSWNYIVVEADNHGNLVNQVFKLEDVYNLIKRGQTALF